MASEELNKLLNEAFLAARAGKKADARRMLEQILEQDDGNEQAWLVLASVVDTPRERRICLENVLEINPNNERAKQALERLRPAAAASAPDKQPPPPPPPSQKTLASPATAASPKPTSAAAQRQAAAKVLTKRAGETSQGTVDAWRSQRVQHGINPTFLIIGIIGAAAIFIGLVLASGGFESGTPTPIPETLIGGNSDSTLVVAVPPTAAGPTLPPTPRGTIVTPPPINASDIPATWTPRPTVTPLPTATTTATLPPLNVYNLIFVGEGRGKKNAALYTVRADGSGEKLFLDTGGPVADPAWSPDGAELAYVGLVDGRQQLILTDASGGNPRVLTRFAQAQNVRTPSWSPDSKQIVFVSNEPGNDELYIIDTDGNNLRRLTNNRFPDLQPVFSPDGQKIAYSADPTNRGAFQIFVRPLDLPASVSPTQLTENPKNSSPTWSPDGQKIAFVSTRSRSIAKIYVMSADGTDERLLTFDDGDAVNNSPIWSPDGKYIVFASNRNEVESLYIMTVDGKNPQLITKTPDKSISPKFQPVS